MQKPYSINLSGGVAIPSEENYLIKWLISGAISTAFSIVIRNNSTNAIVWTLPKTNSYATQYNLLANTLPASGEYKLFVTAYDASNNFATSDGVIFQCSSRPTVTLHPLSTISSPSYEFTATYSQLQSIPIRSWIAYLYDSNNNKLSDSNISTSATLLWLINNLVSEKSYYIEFQATSSLGIIGSSGKIPFSVLYTTPSINTTLSATNIDNAGIHLSMSVVKIEGLSLPSPPIYLNNTEVDLTANGNYVQFNNGLKIESTDFTLKLWLRNLHLTTDTLINENDYLLMLKGNNGWKMFLQYRLDNRFHLFKKVGSYYSHYCSEPILGNGFYVCIQNINRDMNVISVATQVDDTAYFMQSSFPIQIG